MARRLRIAGLCAPLPTLRCHPHGLRRMTQGQRRSQLFHCSGLPPPTPCRFCQRTTFVPAVTLSVYASQWVLPPAHARLDTWLLARLCHGGHLRQRDLLRFKAPRGLNNTAHRAARLCFRILEYGIICGCVQLNAASAVRGLLCAPDPRTHYSRKSVLMCISVLSCGAYERVTHV